MGEWGTAPKTTEEEAYPNEERTRGRRMIEWAEKPVQTDVTAKESPMRKGKRMKSRTRGMKKNRSGKQSRKKDGEKR